MCHSRRQYATPSGSKEYTVRDALNEALAEELESNDKVFVLGEEVAQYNGAYVPERSALEGLPAIAGYPLERLVSEVGG